jgi:hypothetical protein
MPTCCTLDPGALDNKLEEKLCPYFRLGHGAKIISQFIRPCILVSVHKHCLVNLPHFLKNLAA